jgi:hypothetical protein
MIEQVMVVERERLASFLVEYGLVRERLDEALDVILDGHFFLDRPTAEVYRNTNRSFRTC